MSGAKQVASALPNDLAEEDIRLPVLTGYYEALSPKTSKSERVFQACLKMIANSYWMPGDRIPSEVELSRALPVGLYTVQTALSRLVAAGMIQRRRKAGSFVSRPAAAGRELANFLFMDDRGDRYLPIADLELNVYETRAEGAWSGFLTPHRKFVCVERVLTINGEFNLFSRMFLGDPKFRSLLQFSTEEMSEISFRIWFQDRFGTPLQGSDRRVEFTRLDPDLAQRLDQPAGMPAICYDIRQFTLRREPLFFMQTIVPENSRSLQIGKLSH